MLIVEKTKVYGAEEAVRGMRNSFNSWDKSDSKHQVDDGDGDYIDDYKIGPNDACLMSKLYDGGDSHAKYQRFLIVTCDITAPLYWWKEMDTYKVGTVSNSCSTMHTIMERPFDMSMFAHDQMCEIGDVALEDLIIVLNDIRHRWLECDDKVVKKQLWYTIIQLLPSSWLQKRTMLMNYQVLSHISSDRRGHRLVEWAEFLKWVDDLPWSADFI